MSYPSDINFCGNATISSLEKEFKDIESCCMVNYLQQKYGVTNYKSHPQFKFKVCAAKPHDCYSDSRSKYFISNIPNVKKWGEFYFGLIYTKQVDSILHSVAQCESGYKVTIVSPDGGYGLYQITPAAIGDPKIKTSLLLTSEYNTQYGIYHLNKMYKTAKSKYLDDNVKGIDDFIQYLALRGYNGGFKWIDNIFTREKSEPLKYLFTGNFIESSKISGRFVCFEKVNVAYSLKIYMTSKTILGKAF